MAQVSRCAPFGLDHDLRLDEVREDVQLGVSGHVDAVGQQYARQGHHHPAILKREMDQGSEHLSLRAHSSAPAPLSSNESNCCAPVTTTRSFVVGPLVTNQPASVG